MASVAEIDSLPTDTAGIRVAGLEDGKIAALRRLNVLRFLHQDGNSRVTDKGLSHLVTFPELERLDLQGSSEITDQGLLELRLLRGLQWLNLKACGRLTESGVAYVDALRADAGLAAAYAKLKASLALGHTADRASYRAGKAAFIESVLATGGAAMT